MMKAKIVYSALISLLNINICLSQWIQTDGPYASTRITSIFQCNSRLYAGTSCGLHSTTNISDRWDLKSTLRIETYAKKGETVYFGGTESGIQLLDLSKPGFNSESNGLDGVSVVTLKDGDTCLYAGIEVQGFCKSVGYSKNWYFYNTGLPAEVLHYPPSQGGGTYYVRHVNSIETMNNMLFCATHRGVYKTDMNAMIWHPTNTGLPDENVQLLKRIDQNLYAALNNRLYTSSNMGQTWDLLYDAGSKISSVIKSQNSMYMTTDGNGIFISSDNGLTWMNINTGLTDLHITTLAFVDNTPICGTNTKGVFYYNGVSWINNSKGIICTDIWSLATTKNSVAANDLDNVYMAFGKENSWNIISPAVDKNYFATLVSMGDLVFLAYQGNDGGQFIKYYEGEGIWTDLKSKVPYVGDGTYKMFVNNNILYVYEDDHLYATTDLGLTWNDLSLPGQFCNNISDFVVYKNIPFASSCGNAELLRLSNNNQWDLSNSGLPDQREITSMAFSADALYAYQYKNGIFLSIDNGQKWTKATNGYFSDWEIRSFAYLNNNIFVTSIKGVFYSTDFGQHWTLMNDGLKNQDAGPLVIYNDTLFVGTHGNGIWKHDLNDFRPIKKDSTYIIQNIKIFPNPASDYISFDIRDFDKVKLRITDILGREFISAKLNSDRKIDVSKLINGTYIIVITTDTYIDVSKLVIQR